MALLERMTLLPEEFVLPNLTAVQYARLHAPFYPAWSDELFRRMDELSIDLQDIEREYHNRKTAKQ